MTLPRFTSGSIGNLSFEHLNELMDTVDRLRARLDAMDGNGTADSSDWIVARVTNAQSATGSHEWVEVMPDAADMVGDGVRWIDRPGGATSGPPGNQTLYQPAFALRTADFDPDTETAVTFPRDTVVVLRRSKRTDGKRLWLIVNVLTDVPVFPARILGSVLAEPDLGSQRGQRYRYRFWQVAWNPKTQTWDNDAGGYNTEINPPDLYARNGAEVPYSAGVGGSGPGSINNAPIKAGVIVMMSLDGAQPWFSLTNGLDVVC